MSAGSTLATLLTAVKANAAAVAVAGAVVVGGGAAAVAVTTGTVHLPGQASVATHAPDTTPDATSSAAARQQACTNDNGEADQLAKTYSSGTSPLFSTDAAAKTEICTLFVGTNGRAFGFGEVQQMLDLATAIKGGSAASLTSKSCGLTYAGGGDTDVDALLTTIMHDVASGTPLEQLASNCGASTHGQGGGQGGSQGGGKPQGTPGAKPTGTPGRP